jgi:hypothetical protein
MALGPLQSCEVWESFLSVLRGGVLRTPLRVTSGGCAGLPKVVDALHPEACLGRLERLRRHLSQYDKDIRDLHCQEAAQMLPQGRVSLSCR